jgi:hypothetical protein
MKPWYKRLSVYLAFFAGIVFTVAVSGAILYSFFHFGAEPRLVDAKNHTYTLQLKDESAKELAFQNYEYVAFQELDWRDNKYDVIHKSQPVEVRCWDHRHFTVYLEGEEYCRFDINDLKACRKHNQIENRGCFEDLEFKDVNDMSLTCSAHGKIITLIFVDIELTGAAIKNVIGNDEKYWVLVKKA